MNICSCANLIPLTSEDVSKCTISATCSCRYLTMTLAQPK